MKILWYILKRKRVKKEKKWLSDFKKCAFLDIYPEQNKIFWEVHGT